MKSRHWTPMSSLQEVGGGVFHEKGRRSEGSGAQKGEWERLSQVLRPNCGTSNTRHARPMTAAHPGPPVPPMSPRVEQECLQW